MIRKKIFLFLCVFAFCVSSAFSYSLAFQIVQRDVSETSVSTATRLMEESFFEFFFFNGVIVSNSPTQVSCDDFNDSEIFRKSLAESYDGGVDYFVEITGHYVKKEPPVSKIMDIDDISSYSWVLRDVRTGKNIASGECAPERKAVSKNREKSLSDFYRMLASGIQDVIVGR